MLQLAIWSMVILLAVKGFDILHRQQTAVNRGEVGAPKLAQSAALLAFVGGAVLAYLASNAGSAADGRGLAIYERNDPALEAAKRFDERVKRGEVDLGNDPDNLMATN